MPNIARSSRNGPSKGEALQNCSTRCSDDSMSGHNLPCHSFCIMKSIPTKSKHPSSCSHALSAKHRHSDVRTRGTQRLPLCFVTCITLLYLCVSTRNIASRVYGPATSLSACTAHSSGRISKPASPARTASYSTGVLSLRKEPTTHGHLVPRVRMCGATPPLSLYAVMTCKGTSPIRIQSPLPPPI
jgi:hypothetical protein